jgi:hypothetical protein
MPNKPKKNVDVQTEIPRDLPMPEYQFQKLEGGFYQTSTRELEEPQERQAIFNNVKLKLE